MIEVKGLSPEFYMHNRDKFIPLFQKYLAASKDIGFNFIEQVEIFVRGCILDDDCLALVAVDKSLVVGYMVCKTEYRPLTKIKECVIWGAVSMFLNPDTSKKALDLVEKWAKKKDCNIIRANSFRDSMENYIKKFGFEFKFAIFEKEIKGGK